MSKNKNIRVLVVDDDEDDFLLTSHNLRDIPGSAFEVEWASSYEAGLKRIKDCAHDVYIVDYFLGANTGLTLIREAIKAHCEQPMILLTGVYNHEVDEAAVELGAFDYLLKGTLSPDSLERSIRYSLAQAAMLKAVKENEAQFRTVFEKSQDMIFITDELGQLMRVNNSAVSFTGFKVHELLQMKRTDLYANKQQGENIEQALEKYQEVSGLRIELRTKTNERRTCAMYATMQSDRYGKRYCQGVLHDLTAKIREERATMLSEKMEATRRLMLMLAHEVRNPLTNIGLALEGFSAELPDDNDYTEYLEIIKRNAKRIDNLVTQLLDSSRPAALNLKPCSLREVLQMTLEEAKDRLALKKINLATNYTNDADIALVDVEKMQIALTNIIVNAVEAMDESKGILQISTERAAKKLLVSIADNGCGISPEFVNRLFEPYFTSKSKGMGLGLAATLNIVQSHGGTIVVESKEGEGTVFYLTFEAVG
jgi:two-component system, sporulation sensor kinase E